MVNPIGEKQIEFDSVFELGDVAIVGLDIVTQSSVTVDEDLTITFEE